VRLIALQETQPTAGTYFMAAFGFLSLLLSIGLWIHTELFLHRAHRASGNVVRLNQNDNDGHMIYAPVFRFTAEDGQTYTVESNNYSGPSDFLVGQSVQVLYLASEPASARIKTFWQLRGFETVAFLLGCFFPLAAFAYAWWRGLQKRHTGT
jgi:hypothetical protein